MTVDILDVQVTETDVVNTVTETNLFSYTVPANTLGSSNALFVHIHGDYLQGNASTQTVRWKITYGATLMFNDLGAALNNDSLRRAFHFDIILFARNATNAQGLGGLMYMSTPGGGATTGLGDIATDELGYGTCLRGNDATEDSTASKVLKLTVTHSVADALVSVRKLYSVVELVGP